MTIVSASARRPAILLALLLSMLLAPRAAAAQQHGHGDGHAHTARPAQQVKHPDPRPGITGEGVLSDRVVPSRARQAYTIAARIPSILDGLYCYCECHEVRGRRSLLECYLDDMAAKCGMCQAEARLADELHRKGKSLDEIRRAIDARYGG